MKNQALFSSKDKSNKLKCCLLQFLFGALRVKVHCGETLMTKQWIFPLFPTVKTLNIGTPRPATVVVLNIKQFNFTMK